MQVETIAKTIHKPFKKNTQKSTNNDKKVNLNGIRKQKINTTLSTDQWTMQWYENATTEQKNEWSFGTPEFKYCKKRQEFFNKEFSKVWYKSPYKYNMMLKAENLNVENLMVYLDVIYENGDFLKQGVDGVSRSENYFTAEKSISGSNEDGKRYEVKIGPFHFNVCSYKHDGRKFRIIVYVIVPGEDSPVCGLVSPPFLMKAKKPICNPGIKKRKRNYEEFVLNNTSVNASSPSPTYTGNIVHQSVLSSSISSSRALRNNKSSSPLHQQQLNNVARYTQRVSPTATTSPISMQNYNTFNSNNYQQPALKKTKNISTNNNNNCKIKL